jgi:hypothetical protein
MMFWKICRRDVLVGNCLKIYSKYYEKFGKIYNGDGINLDNKKIIKEI